MVTLSLRNFSTNVQQDTVSIDPFGATSRRIAGTRSVEAEIVCGVGDESRVELAKLLKLGIENLEIVVRRKAPTPQQIQSEAKPPPPWDTTPAKKAKPVSADVPETRPEPAEPTTADLVEEFGSWG